MFLPLTPREPGDRANGASAAPAPREQETTEVEVCSPELVGAVLGRALSALAARREIGVDRISDAMLLSDAISAHAPQAFSDGHVRLSIADRDEGVELRVGPMKSGGAEQLRGNLDLPQLGGSLESLADELRVEEGDEGDYLVVGIAALSN